MDQLGYVPHSAAQRLKVGRGYLLGLVVPDIAVPYFGQLAASIEKAADEYGFGVVLSSSSGGRTGRVRGFDLLEAHSIDGIIYVASGDEAGDSAVARLARHFPVVLADGGSACLEGLPVVMADYRLAGRLAAEHLAAFGHTATAVIAGPAGRRSSHDRVAGFLEVFPDATIVDGDFSEEVAYHRASKLLRSDSPPSAFFAANDLSALGVVDAARHAGLSVPRDLSVVGFDDSAVAGHSSPSLTSLRQPIDELGRLAAQALVDLIAGRQPARETVIPIRLVVRESTGPSPA